MDADASGSKNSQIRYEIIRGNYEKKFSIDERTGVIKVQEPLHLNPSARLRRKRNRGAKHEAEFAPLNSGEPVDPVITLVVRAYDLGIPSLDAEVPVLIYTEDMFSRSMSFIISESPESVEEHQDEIRYNLNYHKFITITF